MAYTGKAVACFVINNLSGEHVQQSNLNGFHGFLNGILNGFGGWCSWWSLYFLWLVRPNSARPEDGWREKSMDETIVRRKINLIQHLMRGDGLMKGVMERKMEGKK